MRNLFLGLMLALIALIALPAGAQQGLDEKTLFTAKDNWRIGAIFLNGQYGYCFAETTNNTVALRLATRNGKWQLGIPYYGADRPSGDYQVVPFGTVQNVTFSNDGDGWAVVEVSKAQLEKGVSVHIELKRGNSPQDIHRGPQNWSLTGAAAALGYAAYCDTTDGKSAVNWGKLFGNKNNGGNTGSTGQSGSGTGGAKTGGSGTPFNFGQTNQDPLKITGQKINTSEYSLAQYKFQGRPHIVHRDLRCVIRWDKKQIYDGLCEVEELGPPGTSIEIFGAGVQAKIYAYNPGEGSGGDGLGALKTKWTTFLATGELNRNGNCWQNSSNSFCVYQ